MVLGSIIGAVGGLAGGLLQARSASKLQKNALAANRSRITDTVADAKRAGVHPLFALSSNAPTYSPAGYVGDYGVSQASQHIGRAVDAGLQKDDSQHAKAARDLLLEKGRLENDLLKVQIADATRRVISQPGHPPSPPTGRGLDPVSVGEADRKRSLRVAGLDFQPSPAWSPGQKFEDEYQDLFSLPFMAGKFGTDLVYNLPAILKQLGIPNKKGGKPNKQLQTRIRNLSRY